MRRARRAAALMTAGTLLIGAGCARGDRADEVATVERLDLLSGAEQAGSARFSLQYDIEQIDAGLPGGGFRIVAEMEGETDFAGSRSRAAGSATTTQSVPERAVDEVLPAPTSSFELLTVGPDSWERRWTGGEDPGPWGQTWPGDGGDDGGDDDGSALDVLDPTRGDPTQFLEALQAEARTFTDEGSDTVRGEATTRFRASIDVDADDEDAELWADQSERGVVRVWLDEGDRVRRVEVGGLVVELWDFGVAVEVEAPTEVSDGQAGDLELGFAVAEVSGPWTVESAGSVTGKRWTVFAAAALVGSTEVTCRTLEVEGVEPFGNDVEDFGIDLPDHDGVPALCGAAGPGLGALDRRVVPDPAVQVLPVSTDGYEDAGALVGFSVSPRFRSAPLRIVREGAEPLDLVLDGSGIAVWALDGAVTAIELDDGRVRCPVLDPFRSSEDSDPIAEGSEDGPPTSVEAGLLVYGVEACVSV